MHQVWSLHKLYFRASKSWRLASLICRTEQKIRKSDEGNKKNKKKLRCFIWKQNTPFDVNSSSHFHFVTETVTQTDKRAERQQYVEWRGLACPDSGKLRDINIAQCSGDIPTSVPTICKAKQFNLLPVRSLQFADQYAAHATVFLTANAAIFSIICLHLCPQTQTRILQNVA